MILLLQQSNWLSPRKERLRESPCIAQPPTSDGGTGHPVFVTDPTTMDIKLWLHEVKEQEMVIADS
jgi:hypothetical protein